PPFTAGWERPIIPGTAAITVRFTDSPSGSKSQLIGSRPTVTIYDTPLAASEGFPTGAGALVATQPKYKFARTYYFADLPNLAAFGTCLAPTVGIPLVVRELKLTYNLLDAGVGAAGYDPRAIVSVEFQTNAAPIFDWQMTISPETPDKTDEL